MDDGSAAEPPGAARRARRASELDLGAPRTRLRARASTAGLRARPRTTTWSCSTTTSSPTAAGSRRLQHAAYARPTPASSGPMLLYPDGRIQSAGLIATSARPSGSTTAIASSAPITARPMCPRRPGCHRRVHVPAPRADRRGRLRRGLSDGLRGRRLLPAGLGGGLGVATSRRAAHPPRVAHARHRGRRARAALAGTLLGQVGRLVRRPRRAHARRRRCGSST